MRWLFLWSGAAAITVVGVVLLHFGPALLPGGKGSWSTPLLSLLAAAASSVIVLGGSGMVVGAVGLARSRLRWAGPTVDRREPGRIADFMAYGGSVSAAAALVAVLLIQFGWPLVLSSWLAGPCDQTPSISCFRAHPDYYQEIEPGSSYSTPSSRLYNAVLTPIVIGAFPLALVAAVICVIALAAGTTRRKVATTGVILGSVTVAWMVASSFAFLIFGGGE